MIGPGTIETPVVSADQCHTSCAHSTRDSSIAPNAIENRSATAEAPVNGRTRNRARSISGLWWRAVWAANSVEQGDGEHEHADRPRVSPSPAPALDQPERERPDPRGDQHRARARRAAGSGGPGPRAAGASPRPARPGRSAGSPGTPTASSPQRAGRRRPGRARRRIRRRRSRSGPRSWRRSAGNVARISPSEVGVSSAAPAAWRTRKATSIGRLVAAAHAADAATNTATPSRKPRLRRIAVGQAAEQHEQRRVHDRVAVQHPREAVEAVAPKSGTSAGARR